MLQRILGHAMMEMVNRYVAIAEYDLSLAVKTASPAEEDRQHVIFGRICS